MRYVGRHKGGVHHIAVGKGLLALMLGIVLLRLRLVRLLLLLREVAAVGRRIVAVAVWLHVHRRGRGRYDGRRNGRLMEVAMGRLRLSEIAIGDILEGLVLAVRVAIAVRIVVCLR